MVIALKIFSYMLLWAGYHVNKVGRDAPTGEVLHCEQEIIVILVQWQ